MATIGPGDDKYAAIKEAENAWQQWADKIHRHPTGEFPEWWSVKEQDLRHVYTDRCEESGKCLQVGCWEIDGYGMCIEHCDYVDHEEHGGHGPFTAAEIKGLGR